MMFGRENWAAAKRLTTENGVSKITDPNHAGLSGLFQRAIRRHHRDSFDVTPRAVSGAL